MGLVANILERRSTFANPTEWFRDALAGPRSASGALVNEEKALGLAAVFACVSLISETVASLPFMPFRRLRGGGRDRATEHPLYRLLHDRANPEMTAFEWREAMTGHLELWGNAYSEIEYDNGGRPIALWPLRPDRMLVERIGGQERRLRYQYTVPTGRSLFIPTDRILHWRGLSPDGLIGYSRLSLAREAFGLGLALDEYASRFFGNDARPGGVLEVAGTLSDDSFARLKSSWNDAHQGLSNAHRVAVLDGGVSWKAVGMPPQDAQFLESRKYQRSEIASLFRVPPHMIGDVERSTSWGTGIEQQSIGFVVYTLSTRLRRIEQATSRALLAEAEAQRVFLEFVVDALLRGDSTARAAYLKTMRESGIINANEWRALENMNPQPGDQGEQYLVPLNFVPADQLADLPLPTDPPGPRPGADAQGEGPAPAQPAQPARSRDYNCRECGHLLFRSADERGRIETRCPDRRCRALQTVLLGGQPLD